MKSNLVKHAEYEMQLAWGKFEEMDEMQKYMCDQVLDILNLISTQGDSGSTIGYKMNLLKRLVEFKTISPLTLKDDEFGEPFCGECTRQNKRDSSIFLQPNGKISTIRGLSYVAAHICYDNKDPKFEKAENQTSWTGGTFVFMNDGSVKRVHKCYIKDKYSKHFNIECFDIEHPKDWWIRFTTEDRLKEAADYYDIPFEDATELLNKEIYEFKDGIHADEILKRIELLKEYINEELSK